MINALNPFGISGILLKGGRKSAQDYLEEIMSQRINAMKQNEANPIQHVSYKNIIKNAFAVKNDDYSSRRSDNIIEDYQTLILKYNF